MLNLMLDPFVIGYIGGAACTLFGFWYGWHLHALFGRGRN